MKDDLTRLKEAVENEVEMLNNLINEDEAFDEFISDILDVEYVLDDRFELKNVKLTLCFGGPSVYADTYGDVIGYWGDKTWEAHYDEDVANMLFDYFEDYYESSK